VRGIDNFLTGKQANIDSVLAQNPHDAARFDFLRGDIRKPDDCEKAMQGIDVVLHHAAVGSVPWSIQEPILAHECNVTGFLNVLEAAKNHGVKRIVYASSSAVYGDSPLSPNVESQIGAALSPYAASKRCNELYAESYARAYSLELVGLRYFNVFGPRQDPNGAYAAVIPKWLQAMRQKQSCIIYGNGESTRDYCYIDNVVHANLLAASAPLQAPAPVYNIAVGAATSLSDLHKIMSEALAERAAIQVAAPTFAPPRQGDILHSRADISKAQRELGYHAICTVAEGIQNTINFECKNPL